MSQSIFKVSLLVLGMALSSSCNPPPAHQSYTGTLTISDPAGLDLYSSDKNANVALDKDAPTRIDIDLRAKQLTVTQNAGQPSAQAYDFDLTVLIQGLRSTGKSNLRSGTVIDMNQTRQLVDLKYTRTEKPVSKTQKEMEVSCELSFLKRASQMLAQFSLIPSAQAGLDLSSPLNPANPASPLHDDQTYGKKKVLMEIAVTQIETRFDFIKPGKNESSATFVSLSAPQTTQTVIKDLTKCR